MALTRWGLLWPDVTSLRPDELDASDRAKLDLYAHELWRAILKHADDCLVCSPVSWCDPLIAALETLLGWYDGRTLMVGLPVSRAA